MSPEDNPADDQQPTKVEWEEYMAERGHEQREELADNARREVERNRIGP